MCTNLINDLDHSFKYAYFTLSKFWHQVVKCFVLVSYISLLSVKVN